MIKIGPKFITVAGKRIGVNYFTGPWIMRDGINPDMIKIRPRRGLSFPAEMRAAFTIENNSDAMTDYFEADCIRLIPGHPHYEAVKAAAGAR